MGIYTKEEIEDGNFKEYPMADLQEQVKNDITQNANTEDFPIGNFEEVTEKKPEPEPAADESAAIADADMPDFMK